MRGGVAARARGRHGVEEQADGRLERRRDARRRIAGDQPARLQHAKPIAERERRQALEGRKMDVLDMLDEGAKKARITAGATMAEVREALKI